MVQYTLAVQQRSFASAATGTPKHSFFLYFASLRKYTRQIYCLSSRNFGNFGQVFPGQPLLVLLDHFDCFTIIIQEVFIGCLRRGFY